ncbi:hypothetical protein NP493_1303g00022 [Ridgeia piscesae]|uniref:Uncharacterized protein n=1 Tax=Ridgeia piscesae TaxID=27915 RepID=A0AAD9K8R0_RIDPI|nr:hypothetical protein NP493_1303g00022 [Ridgeia piscesae]
MGIYNGHLYRYRERDQEFLNLVQDSFLSQHVLEQPGAERVRHVLSSQNEFVDNVKICEPLGCSDQPDTFYHQRKGRTE